MPKRCFSEDTAVFKIYQKYFKRIILRRDQGVGPLESAVVTAKPVHPTNDDSQARAYFSFFIFV